MLHWVAARGFVRTGSVNGWRRARHDVKLTAMSEWSALDAGIGEFYASKTLSKGQRTRAQTRPPQGMGGAMVGARRSKVLGHCSEITKSQADALMASILQPLNEGAGQRQVPAYTFGDYLDKAYLPSYRRKWKESTRMTTEATINTHLRPAFGSLLIRSITRDQLQAFLDKTAEKRSRSVVEHLRWLLNAIFRMAASEGIVEFNPADALFASAAGEERERRVMTSEEIRLALSVLEVPERLMFRMAVFDGMRPGEILAVRLGKISENSILVDRRVYKGNLDSPKGRKGKSNARIVALSPGTRA